MMLIPRFTFPFQPPSMVYHSLILHIFNHLFWLQKLKIRKSLLNLFNDAHNLCTKKWITKVARSSR